MNTEEILRRFENQIESLNETQDLTDYAHNMLGGLLVEIRNNLVKESDSLPCVSLRLFDAKMDGLTKEIEEGYTDEGDDYKRHEWRCDQRRSMQIARNLIFPDAS